MQWDLSDLNEWLVFSDIWGYNLPSLLKTYCKTSLSSHTLPTESNLATAAVTRSSCWANEEAKVRKSYSEVVDSAQLLTGNTKAHLQHSVVEQNKLAFSGSLGSDLCSNSSCFFSGIYQNTSLPMRTLGISFATHLSQIFLKPT